MQNRNHRKIYHGEFPSSEPRAPDGRDTLILRQKDLDARRVQDFASASEGWFWEMDGDLRFTFFSDSVLDVAGVMPEWHFGKTREEILRDNSVSFEQWRRHSEDLDHRRPFSDFVFLREGPDGAAWMRTSGKPVYGADGAFLGYRGVARDS